MGQIIKSYKEISFSIEFSITFTHSWRFWPERSTRVTLCQIVSFCAIACHRSLSWVTSTQIFNGCRVDVEKFIPPLSSFPSVFLLMFLLADIDSALTLYQVIRLHGFDHMLYAVTYFSMPIGRPVGLYVSWSVEQSAQFRYWYFCKLPGSKKFPHKISTSRMQSKMVGLFKNQVNFQ